MIVLRIHYHVHFYLSERKNQIKVFFGYFTRLLISDWYKIWINGPTLIEKKGNDLHLNVSYTLKSLIEEQARLDFSDFLSTLLAIFHVTNKTKSTVVIYTEPFIYEHSITVFECRLITSFVFRQFWRRSYQNQLSFPGKDSTAFFSFFVKMTKTENRKMGWKAH
jgi:hypothetical protein